MLERPGVAHLAAAARVERRAVEHDPAGRGVDDGRAVLVQIGLLVAEVHGHGLEPSDVRRRQPAVVGRAEIGGSVCTATVEGGTVVGGTVVAGAVAGDRGAAGSTPVNSTGSAAGVGASVESGSAR